MDMAFLFCWIYNIGDEFEINGGFRGFDYYICRNLGDFPSIADKEFVKLGFNKLSSICLYLYIKCNAEDPLFKGFFLFCGEMGGLIAWEILGFMG